MKEMIIRLSTEKNDVEVLTNTRGKQLFKVIQKNKLLDILEKRFSTIQQVKDKKPKVLTENIYAMGSDSVAIIQYESKRIVTFEKKSYKVSFPNSFYIVYHDGKKILNIYAYTFKKFEGNKTELYKYPMPNMLGGNEMCIGTSVTEIGKRIENALNGIIETQFTHINVDNIKGFKETKGYFEYLSKNDFPYKFLIKTKLKVGDLVDE